MPRWQGPTKDWMSAGGVMLDPQNPKRLAAEPGKGVIVNSPKGRARNLISKQKFGDVEVHVEFLIPRGSNSGVKLEGQYEIQILDSYGRKELTGDDCGGIYPRAEMEPQYHHIDEGIPPRVNAARPAGTWQTLDIRFRAPRFDARGRKTANPRFLRVVLNGHPQRRLPNTLNAGFLGHIGAELLAKVPEVAASTGSACHEGKVTRSPVLCAMGVPLEANQGAVRLSVGRFTTEDEVDRAAALLVRAAGGRVP